jgi:hypothetical protein
MRCADGQYRRCYPVLACYCGDYEEQVIVTNILKLQECPKCDVSLKEPSSDSLSASQIQPPRTHGTEDERKAKDTLKTSEAAKRYAQIQNFAWGLPNVNIHNCMTADMLHVFFSNGMIKYLYDWLTILMTDPTIKDSINKRHLSQASKHATFFKTHDKAKQFLDRRIQQCPSIPTLQALSSTKDFSKIVQRSGKEWRTLSRILLVALVPILPKVDPIATIFLRCFLDFATILQYRSHDDQTLDDLQRYLETMNICKVALQDAKPNLKFPKWHTLTHFIECIKQFGSVDSFDTTTGEHLHGRLVKRQAKRVNYRGTWIDQLINAIDLRCWETILQDMHLHEVLTRKASGKRTDIHQSDGINPNITKASPSKLSDLPPALKDHAGKLPSGIPIGTRIACRRRLLTADVVAEWADLPQLLHALPPFIRSQRLPLGEEDSHEHRLDRKAAGDDDWGSQILLQLHKSFSYYSRDFKSTDPDMEEKQYARCDWSHQNTDTWRNDFIWAQEYEVHHTIPGAEKLDPLQGRIPVQPLLVMTIHDIQHRKNDSTLRSTKALNYPTYECALVQEFRPIDGSKLTFAPFHGLPKFHIPPLSGTSQSLGSCKIYPLITLGPHVHLFPSEPMGKRPKDKAAQDTDSVLCKLRPGGRCHTEKCHACSWTRECFLNVYATHADFTTIYDGDFWQNHEHIAKMELRKDAGRKSRTAK